MPGTRYSKTREAQAQHTACTKLTWPDKQALHYMAVERGLSDYQFTRTEYPKPFLRLMAVHCR